MKRKITPPEADNAVEKLVSRYSRYSRILHPRGARGIENMINMNDLQTLKTELLELQGNSRGEYWNPGRRNASNGDLHTSVLPSLKAAREALQELFKKYKRSEIASGNRVPKDWPSNLLEDKNINDAHIRVCELEIEKLEGLIAPLEAAIEKEESAPVPRKSWASCELKDGLLHRIAGWLVGFPENEEILHIQDDRSPFNGMPVWRFKTQILRPLEHEKSYRQRQELKQAELDDRRPKAIEPVATPLYNSASKVIEYPNYSNVVIKRIKKDM